MLWTLDGARSRSDQPSVQIEELHVAGLRHQMRLTLAAGRALVVTLAATLAVTLAVTLDGRQVGAWKPQHLELRGLRGQHQVTLWTDWTVLGARVQKFQCVDLAKRYDCSVVGLAVDLETHLLHCSCAGFGVVA